MLKRLALILMCGVVATPIVYSWAQPPGGRDDELARPRPDRPPFGEFDRDRDDREGRGHRPPPRDGDRRPPRDDRFGPPRDGRPGEHGPPRDGRPGEHGPPHHDGRRGEHGPPHGGHAGPRHDGPGRPNHLDNEEIRELNERDRDLYRESAEVARDFQGAKGDAERDELRGRLVELVNEHFEVRQERRRLMLEHLEQEIARLRESIEARDESRGDLIEERVGDLIGDGRPKF